MAEICEEIKKAYDDMKKYPKDLFDKEITTFLKGEKYKQNADIMNNFIEKMDKKNIINIITANKTLQYECVNRLIAYKFSDYVHLDMTSLESIFSEFT